MENTNDCLTGRDLMRLKEEYASAVVEKMTQKEARAYLRQIIYNDVAVADGLELSARSVRSSVIMSTIKWSKILRLILHLTGPYDRYPVIGLKEKRTLNKPWASITLIHSKSSKI